MTAFQPAIESQTLSQKMTIGRLPASEALRYAIQIAESLQRLHDEGRVHGSLSPAAAMVSGGHVHLLPAVEPAVGGPYSAPEVALGSAPDARADIFSFGAMLFEMLTGERALRGDGLHAVPSSGSRPVDRVVQTCLAEDPNKRYQRIAKLMLELKLLAVAARRAESAAAKRDDPATMLRMEMRQMEERIVERFDMQERARTELAQAVDAALQDLRGQIDTAAQRDAALEQSTAALHLAAASLRDSTVAELDSLGSTLNVHASAIDSARTAMAQTDNLVERVVEALEALQSIVLEGTAGQ